MRDSEDFDAPKSGTVVKDMALEPIDPGAPDVGQFRIVVDPGGTEAGEAREAGEGRIGRVEEAVAGCRAVAGEVEGNFVQVAAGRAALEKYLGSGLIKGVGPKTATKIVKHFKEKTLEVFEDRIDDLLSVPGIAEKKLIDIKNSWQEHKSIRDVMLLCSFLPLLGILTYFLPATKRKAALATEVTG